MTPRGSPTVPPALRWAESASPAATEASGSWELSGHPQLSAMRREARILLVSSADPSGGWTDAHDEVVDRTVLSLDELASNALRHGLAPVSAELFDLGESWLVVITDGAIAVLPVPAVGRPGGRGGFGLYVVAEFALAHGIDVRGDHKRVWAQLPKR